VVYGILYLYLFLILLLHPDILAWKAKKVNAVSKVKLVSLVTRSTASPVLQAGLDVMVTRVSYSGTCLCLPQKLNKIDFQANPEDLASLVKRVSSATKVMLAVDALIVDRVWRVTRVNADLTVCPEKLACQDQQANAVIPVNRVQMELQVRKVPPVFQAQTEKMDQMVRKDNEVNRPLCRWIKSNLLRAIKENAVVMVDLDPKVTRV
jgi:hypothetical protein